VAFFPPHKTLRWAHLFVQDDIRLSDALSVTLGAKVERNEYTGGEFLPNLRFAWQPDADRLVWGAWSRAVRAPSRVDREYHVPGAPPFFLAGGPGFVSEIANVGELGYRALLAPTFAWSITAFHHEFDRVRSVEPRAPGLQIENLIEGRTRGVETWAEYRPLDRWRLAAGLVQQQHRFHRVPGSQDTLGLAAVGNDPERWWTLRSSLDITPRIEFDLMMRRIGALPNPPVPAYTALDARLGWRLRADLEVAFVVRNALDAGHVEWGTTGNRAEFERSYMVRLLWQP
jgi:iron complex outermembrane recepter protein